MAAINFVNLTTARAQSRAQEVGVRKAVGAGRGELIARFLAESVVLSLFALVLACGLAGLGVGLLENVTGRTLDVSALVTWEFALAALGCTLVVGLLAGVYPAFVLSAFEPVRVLRGSRTSVMGGGKGLTLRRALVGTQFVVSIALVAATLVALQQNRFLRTADLGFDNAQTVAIQIKGEQGWEVLRDALRATDGVESVTAASIRPGLGNTQGLPYRVSGDGSDPGGYGSDNPQGGGNQAYASVTDDFDEQMGLRILAGRTFGPEFPADQGVVPEQTTGRDVLTCSTEDWCSTSRQRALKAGRPKRRSVRSIACTRMRTSVYFSDIRGASSASSRTSTSPRWDSPSNR